MPSTSLSSTRVAWPTCSRIATVFVAGEVALTMLILTAGRHPQARETMTRLGAIAVPLLLCVVGFLVLLSAGTLSWL